ncbi:head GIN domain-containing protein [Massilia sp. TWP1-3-3]|uniref:head GIN domain-containing protein n=1 Tax=Massilia sp. TWP1-3-3 TaxID=2804573 RepID=UPI003CF54825
MRPLLALTLVAAAALAGCAIIVAPNDGDVSLHTVFGKDAVVGDGKVMLERRAVSAGLTEFDMSGPLQVELRVGPAPSLQVEADSNLLPLIRTENTGAAMRVWVQGGVRTNNSLRIIYTTPQLGQIRASGSGRLVASGFNGGALTLTKSGSGESQLSGKVGSLNMALSGSGSVNASALQSGNANLELNGSGRLTMGEVRADALNVKVHGSGDMLASGAATNVNARVFGSGGVNLMALASERADLSTNGSGDISARVRQALVAQTNGSGSITVYGDPAQRSISGKHVHVVAN